MPTSVPGSDPPRRPPGLSRPRRGRGFTLLELLVVVGIIAFATAGVGFALRDTASAQLEREALRLAALLEAARTQSRTSGIPMRWAAAPGGFHFDGAAPGSLPDQWLSEATRVLGTATLVLGPEPILRPQAVVLASAALPGRSVRVATDGLRPFAVAAGESP